MNQSEQSTPLYTLAEFLDDVEQNPDLPIWYHPQATWWTNKYEDLEAATILGSEAVLSKMRQEMLAEGDLARHKNLSQKYEALSSSGKSNMPLAPDGSPLFITKRLSFLQNNGLNLVRLGEYGLNMLMAHHHQNCDGKITNKWEDFEHIAERLAVVKMDEERLMQVISGRRSYGKIEPDGKIIPMQISGVPQRNDKCPCGSGKKWKTCHGKE